MDFSIVMSQWLLRCLSFQLFWLLLLCSCLTIVYVVGRRGWWWTTYLFSFQCLEWRGTTWEKLQPRSFLHIWTSTGHKIMDFSIDACAWPFEEAPFRIKAYKKERETKWGRGRGKQRGGLRWPYTPSVSRGVNHTTELSHLEAFSREGVSNWQPTCTAVGKWVYLPQKGNTNKAHHVYNLD